MNKHSVAVQDLAINTQLKYLFCLCGAKESIAQPQPTTGGGTDLPLSQGTDTISSNSEMHAPLNSTSSGGLRKDKKATEQQENGLILPRI